MQILMIKKKSNVLDFEIHILFEERAIEIVTMSENTHLSEVASI